MKRMLLFLVVLNVVLSVNAHASVTNYDCCDKKCTCTYDSVNLALDFKPKEGVTGEILMSESDTRGRNLTVRTMTVHEGINGARTDGNGYIAMYVNTTSDSVAKLPSTFHTQGSTFFNSHFTTVDLSDVQNENQSVNIGISGTGLQHIIMEPDSKVQVSIGVAYDSYYPSRIEIDCKGTDKSICLKKVKNVKTDAQGNMYLTIKGENIPVTTEYFSGYDDGKYVEWGESGKKVFDLPNGDYRFYDEDGNYVGNFMANGSKRRIYAIDEAVAATEKGNKNRFVLRYR